MIPWDPQDPRTMPLSGGCLHFSAGPSPLEDPPPQGHSPTLTPQTHSPLPSRGTQPHTQLPPQAHSSTPIHRQGHSSTFTPSDSLLCTPAAGPLLSPKAQAAFCAGADASVPEETAGGSCCPHWAGVGFWGPGPAAVPCALWGLCLHSQDLPQQRSLWPQGPLAAQPLSPSGFSGRAGMALGCESNPLLPGPLASPWHARVALGSSHHPWAALSIPHHPHVALGTPHHPTGFPPAFSKSDQTAKLGRRAGTSLRVLIFKNSP